MTDLKVLSLFSGIGAFEKALENLCISYELVNFSEIDKYAIKSYCAIHNVDESKNLGDITQIDISKLDIDIDLITHGSPCQDFSVAGANKGGDEGTNTRSSLMWNTVEIVKQCNPKYVVWENVKNVLSKKHKHNFDKYLKELYENGYESYYKVLNAKDYGIPQNRERIFVISIRKDLNQKFIFPDGWKLDKRLKDILETDVDDKFYIKKPFHLVNKGHQAELDIKGHDCIKRVYGTDNLCPTLTTMGGGNTEPKILLELPCIAASRGRNPLNPSSRVAGEHTEQRLEFNKNGTSNTLTTVQKDNLVIEPVLTIDENIKPSVRCNFEHEKELICKSDKDIYQCKCNSGWQDNKVGIKVTPTLRANNSSTYVKTDFRIRKLTPLECWRLMGFTDEDFNKAKAVGISNTQLYKQAGNSIVVNVLEEIFKNLL